MQDTMTRIRCQANPQNRLYFLARSKTICSRNLLSDVAVSVKSSKINISDESHYFRLVMVIPSVLPLR